MLFSRKQEISLPLSLLLSPFLYPLSPVFFSQFSDSYRSKRIHSSYSGIHTSQYPERIQPELVSPLDSKELIHSYEGQKCASWFFRRKLKKIKLKLARKNGWLVCLWHRRGNVYWIFSDLILLSEQKALNEVCIMSTL